MKKILVILVLNLLVSFPLFHYIYIHGNVRSGDYDNYVEMVKKPIDFSSTEAPFVIRQFTPVLSNLLYSNNIFYNSFTNYTEDIEEKKIYFSLLSINYLGVLISMCFLTWLMSYHKVSKHLFVNLIPGLFLLLSYKTIFVGIFPLTEGFGILMSLILFYLYENNLSLIAFAFFCLLAIFVREITLLFIAIYMSIDIIKNFIFSIKYTHKIKYLLSGIICCVAYLIVRKYFIPIEGYQKQIEISGYYANLSSFFKNLTIEGFLKIFYYQTILIIISTYIIVYKNPINFKKSSPLIITVLILSFILIMMGLTSYGLPRFISSLNAVYLYQFIKNNGIIKNEEALFN